jgi:glutamyl-tRNA synthetase
MQKDPVYANYKNALKGAVDGQVVTRFPPEPSGFLHIGHVKAAMLNYHYSKVYNGKMILRFDDTNPMNEKIEFVENIQRDLKTLEIVPDQVTHTSDYFPQIVEYMQKLIADGNAYADNGTGEEMKDQRDNGLESPARAKTPEESLKIFADMLAGKAEGHCIRAKMNMQDKFKCLRDPVFYRCKNEAHHRHGTTYKAYPTYDFACPIVDALEGVTHAMRTLEYVDRNGGYAWVQKVLGLRSVELYSYSRLNLVSTVLSKRSLKWFVEEGIADGWNDPRFPTVQGIMRRGMKPEALKRFMLEQGPSKNTNLMEWDKLWAYNKDAIDKVAPRYTAIVKETQAKLILSNGPEKIRAETHPLHQKNADLGVKAVLYGKELLVEAGDASPLAVGEKITLMKWGNCTITKKDVAADGSITLTGEIDENDKDFKGTKKLTWIAVDESTNLEVTLVELDHLITKKKVEENEKVEDIVNRDSYIAYNAIAEGNMRNLKQGDVIQLERRGYFFVDKLELGAGKMTLNFIPDGKSKNMSAIESKLDQKVVSGGHAGKTQEK